MYIHVHRIASISTIHPIYSIALHLFICEWRVRDDVSSTHPRVETETIAIEMTRLGLDRFKSNRLDRLYRSNGMSISNETSQYIYIYVVYIYIYILICICILGISDFYIHSIWIYIYIYNK